ncbi:3'-5' exonuclease, partial [Vibrio sp. FNV 38]|nr:3'-5' exonuclease [Vibrio sp. FNV 38]
MQENKEDLVFDSETTGLGSDAEIVELSLVGAITGEVYLDTLVKPLSPIPEDATAIHGITNQNVESAPSWPEVHDQFCQLVDGRKVHI